MMIAFIFFRLLSLKIDKPGNLKVELDLWIPEYNLALEYQGKNWNI